MHGVLNLCLNVIVGKQAPEDPFKQSDENTVDVQEGEGGGDGEAAGGSGPKKTVNLPSLPFLPGEGEGSSGEDSQPDWDDD